MITALLAPFPRNHSFLMPDYISAQSPHQAKSEIRINEILNKPRPNKFKLGKSKTSNPIWTRLQFVLRRSFEFVSVRGAAFVLRIFFRFGSALQLALRLTFHPSPRMERQRERKSAALPNFTVQPNLSAMQFDKLLGQG